VIIDIGNDPLERLETEVGKLAQSVSVRLALPVISRSWERPALVRKVAALRAAGFARWEVSNLAGWTLLGLDPASCAHELSLAADWPLYVTNLTAARALREMGIERVTLSPEDGLANLSALLPALGDAAQVVVFQDTPLMLSESCAWANLVGGCPGPRQCSFEQMELTSTHGGTVLVVNERCRSVTLNSRPLCLADKLGALVDAGARRFRADFVHRPYEPSRVRALWGELRAGRVPEGHLANFHRGLG